MGRAELSAAPARGRRRACGVDGDLDGMTRDELVAEARLLAIIMSSVPMPVLRNPPAC